MPSGPGRNSQERLLRLREQEKRIAAELRSARRMQRHAGDIPADLWAAARAVHLRAGPSTTLALAFLEHHRPGARARAAALEEGLRAIWHASTPAERASAAVEPGAPALGNAWRRAGKWMQEAGLHTWVHDLNVAKGIAPVASLTLAEIRRRQVASPHLGLVRSIGPKRKPAVVAEMARPVASTAGAAAARRPLATRGESAQGVRPVTPPGDFPLGESGRTARFPLARGGAVPGRTATAKQGSPGGPEIRTALFPHAQGRAQKTPPLFLKRSAPASRRGGRRGLALVELPPCQRPRGQNAAAR